MRLIEKTEELKDFCSQELPEFITIDTEFLRDKTYYPQLCLVQIGGKDIEPVAIDTLKKSLDLNPLLDLLRNKKILKVFHAGTQDLEIFYKLLDGKLPEPVFDSQIAASVLGYGEQISYHALVKKICKEDLDKSRQYTNWALRPLSKAQLTYAIGDVTHLIKIYERLRDQLTEQKRLDWINEEMSILLDPKRYKNDPNEAWRRIRLRSNKKENYVVLRELAAWREIEAQTKDVPKQRILKDDVISQMALTLPKEPKNLKRIRGLQESYQRPPKAKIFLDLVKAGLEKAPKARIDIPKNTRSGKDVTNIVDMLKLLLKINANEHNIIGRMIASSDDLENFAQGKKKDILFLKGWRYDIFGKDAEKLVQGKLSLGLKNGKIMKK